MVLYLSVIYKMIQYFLSLIILVVVAHKHTHSLVIDNVLSFTYVTHLLYQWEQC